MHNKMLTIAGVSILGLCGACTSETTDGSGSPISSSRAFAIEPGIDLAQPSFSDGDDERAIRDLDLDHEFSVTLVERKEDGTLIITQHPVTLRQELEDRDWEAVEADAKAKGILLQQTRISTDYPACTELHVYDQSGKVGNQMCWKGGGVVDLGAVPRGAGGSCQNYWWGYSKFLFGGHCNTSVSTSNFVKSLTSVVSGDFTPAFKDCSPCYHWPNSANDGAVSAGNCEYMTSGPPAIPPTCP